MEPVNGQIKEARGLRRFLLRGLVGLPRFSGQVSGLHAVECTGADELLLVVDRAEVANR